MRPSSTSNESGSRRLLVVDDDPLLLRLLSRQLEGLGYEVSPFESAEQALASARERGFDGAVLDYSLGATTGLELMEQLREVDSSLTVILLSGTIEVPEAVQSIRRGAEDVQLKPPNFEMLQAALERGLERTQLRRSKRLMAAHVVDPYGVLDPSPAMQRVLRQVQHAARLDMPVLLVGETGTGRRAIAEMIHQLSPRSTQPFRSIGLHDGLEAVIAEASAVAERTGQSGTVFLDDVSVLPVGAQQALLRLLDAQRLRVVVSTRRDLSEDVRSGRLLLALHLRLSALPIFVPALGERGTVAVSTLARRFLGRLRIDAGEGPDDFTEPALDWLCHSRWPANIPQLRDVITESFIRAIGEPAIDAHHLTPSFASRGLHAGTAAQGSDDWSLASMERRQILTVLGMAGGNRSQAARLLGITRTTLYKKLADYGMSPDE